MKKGLTVFLIIIFLSSIVSATGLFEGSAWGDWLTGNQILKKLTLQKKAITATQTSTSKETTIDSETLPNIFLAPAEGPVSAAEYNRLLSHYEDVVHHLKNKKNFNLITDVSIINFNPEDYLALGVSQSTLYSYLVVQYNTRDYGVFVVTQDGHNPLEGAGVILTPNFKVKSAGRNVNPSFVSAGLLSLKTKDTGYLLTSECGVAQEGVVGLNKELITNPLRNDEKISSGKTLSKQDAEAAKAAVEGKGGYLGGKGQPVSGYVSLGQGRDPGSAGERQKQGCDKARSRARSEELKRKQEENSKFNEKREGIEGEGSPDLPTDKEVADAAKGAAELKQMAAEHQKAFEKAVKEARATEGMKQAMAGAQLKLEASQIAVQQ